MTSLTLSTGGSWRYGPLPPPHQFRSKSELMAKFEKYVLWVRRPDIMRRQHGFQNEVRGWLNDPLFLMLTLDYGGNADLMEAKIREEYRLSHHKRQREDEGKKVSECLPEKV